MWNSSAATGRIFMNVYIRVFFEAVEKVQVLLKSGRNNVYFTWRTNVNFFYYVSLSFSLNDKCFRQKFYRISATYFMFNNFFFFEKSSRL